MHYVGELVFARARGARDERFSQMLRKRRLLSQRKLAEDEAEGVDVDRPPIRATRSDFRRGVERRPTHRHRTRRHGSNRADDGGETKIPNFDDTRRGEHDVVGLDVAVNEILGV